MSAVGATLRKLKNLVEKTTPEFRSALCDVADRLGIDPNWLATVIAFETGYTWSPSVRNKQSGATGLIQFLPSTAAGLGTTVDELARMTAVQQLYWVEKYFKGRTSKVHRLEDLYLLVLYPVAVGTPDDHVVFSSPSKAYVQNASFDTGKKGFVTTADVTKTIRNVHASASGTVAVDPVKPGGGRGPALAGLCLAVAGAGWFLYRHS